MILIIVSKVFVKSEFVGFVPIDELIDCFMGDSAQSLILHSPRNLFWEAVLFEFDEDTLFNLLGYHGTFWFILILM